MRSRQHLRLAESARSCLEGPHLRVHVQRRARNLAALQASQQISLVHNAATGHIHDPNALLALGERGSADEVGCLRGLGHVQGDEVAAGPQLVQADLQQ